jgi:uncharacterized membrane-anchored protein
MTRLRSVDSGRGYWVVMLAASTFGANLGDYWVDELALGRPASFGLLAAICVVAVLVDRHVAAWTEASYWTAIVALRAAATNLGDLMTHELGIGYGRSTIILGVLAVTAASFTRPAPGRASAPSLDLSYWLAMLAAGLFGTVGGDLVSHSVGLYASSALLCGALVLALAVRGIFAAAGMLTYWLAVFAERFAGTALGDTIASERALGLGLPTSLALTGCVLLLAIAVREWLGRRHRVSAGAA